MAVLQFSNEDPDNPHHPDNHRKDTVVYTGTHDNNTTVGWGNIPVEDMIISAMTSPAGLCVIPIQDVLQLGSEARMNTPGTTEGNWCWTFEWKDLESMPVEWFRENATRLRPRT
jgi:4-alpha-glucanotransferase